MATYKIGQTVYNESGERAEYVTATGDGHIVRPVVEVYDDDEEYDHVCDPTMWRKVFSQPPVAKYSDELKALHAQIASAKAERDQMQREQYERERDRAAKLKRFALLDNLEDFIDGKITHYVEAESSYSPPKIISVADAKSNESGNWRETLRLLTLGGNLRNGEVSWILGQYSDGSGGGSKVVPCTSREQAIEVVKAAVVKHFASTSSDRREDESWIRAAESLGVAIPEAYRLAVAKARLNTIERNISYSRKQASDYADSVRKADEELAALRAYVASSEARS